jgi:hypothetical protein
VPEWKWEEIAMDFIMGLPRTRSGYDSIWVIVERLTKVAHFIPIKTIYSGPQLTKLYMSRIVCLHGVPKKTVSDRGHNVLRSFGRGCMKPWIPNCASVRLITLRPMVRLKDLIRYLKICLELVPCNMEEVGIRVCLTPSFPITTTIKKA